MENTINTQDEASPVLFPYDDAGDPSAAEIGHLIQLVMAVK